MKKNYFMILRIFLTILIGIAFMALENVIGLRRVQIYGLFIIIILMPVLRMKWQFIMSFMIDLTCLFLLALLSRYVINYYVYALYMLILVEIGYTLSLKKGKYLIGLTVILTLYHYSVLYNYRSNWGTVSEIFFMLLINVVIILSLVMFDIITREREKQKALNLTLQTTNEKLEQLTRLAVKTNIARDIHDSFGHDMMALIMQLEMADVLISKSPDEAKIVLRQAKSSARDGMKTIRKVVESLRTEEGEIITQTLDELIDEYSDRVNVDVIKTIEAEIFNLSKKVHDVLYRLVQECMTNSVRHGQATQITINIHRKNETVHFSVKDNGIGADEIHEGYGLKGMKERIDPFNGQVRYKNNNGFEVKGYIEVGYD